ncbi:MAG: MYXO-CTERM sorting domain-containing protein [bacterium]
MMYRRSALLALAICCVGALCAAPGAARAEDAGVADAGDATEVNPLEYADEVRTPIHFEYESLAIEGLCDIPPVDTGWVPQGSPIQVRFTFGIGCGYRISMDGYAVGGWPPRPGPQLSFRGRTLGGFYEMNYTLDFDVSVRLDVEIAGIQITEEIDIPYLPDLHFGLYDKKRFTPFLLLGNPDRPFQIQDDIPYTQILRINILELLQTNVPSDLVAIYLDLYVSGYAGSRFEGRRIVVEHGEVNPEFEIPPLVYTVENEKQWLPVNPNDATPMQIATYEGAATHYASISIWPEVTLEILNSPFMNLPLFEIPFPLPDTDEYWIFDPVSFGLPLPNLKVAERMMVGAAEIGSEVQAQLTIQNVGGHTLRGEAHVDAPFFVPYPPRFEVAPDGAVYLPVLFRPSLPGPASAELILYSNDPNEAPKVVRVEGIGCEVGGACEVPEDAVWTCGLERKCGCQASDPGPALGSLLLALLALVWIRRRRR